MLHLILSPHYDDAILSLGGLMAAGQEIGDRFHILTVFSEGDGDKYAIYGQRKQENQAAASSIGATTGHLGLVDSTSRHGFYKDFCSILFSRHPLDDAAYVADLADRLGDAFRQHQPDRIWAPLAIGWHIDHRLVLEAVQQLIKQGKIDARRLGFYEDRPYCFLPHARSARLFQLGQGVVAEKNGLNQAISQSHFYQAILPRAGDRLRFAELALQASAENMSCPKMRSQVVGYDASVESKVARAIGMYQTEMGLLFGDTTTMRREMNAYARSMSDSAIHAERYWQFQGAA